MDPNDGILDDFGEHPFDIVDPEHPGEWPKACPACGMGVDNQMIVIGK